MHPVKTFHVRPALPERLKALEQLAYNLRWSWDHESINLFRRLDRQLWDGSGHNPVLMLGSLAQGRLQELAQDDAFLAHLDSVAAGLSDYVASSRTWYQKQYGRSSRSLMAYFSLDLGLTESLPIYSGGPRSARERGDPALLPTRPGHRPAGLDDADADSHHDAVPGARELARWKERVPQVNADAPDPGA